LKYYSTLVKPIKTLSFWLLIVFALFHVERHIFFLQAFFIHFFAKSEVNEFGGVAQAQVRVEAAFFTGKNSLVYPGYYSAAFPCVFI
jgi:hypothetical protein